jgi:hypothetical protein
MDHLTGEKLSHVTSEGRTVVDANALLRQPKVQQVLARLTANKHLFSTHRGPGIALVKRVKSDS